MKITVKRWIADQKNTEAKRYNLFPNVEYISGFYADVENDTVTYTDAEIVAESAKAVKVELGCGNTDGKVGIFTAWLPKSQIVNA